MISEYQKKLFRVCLFIPIILFDLYANINIYLIKLTRFHDAYIYVYAFSIMKWNVIYASTLHLRVLAYKSIDLVIFFNATVSPLVEMTNKNVINN